MISKKLLPSFLITLTVFLSLAVVVPINQDLYAEPGCQVLDRSASKASLTLDLFGDTKRTRIEQIKAYLWIDPDFPEGARLMASLQPQISKLFGKFEENPLMIGMLANFLDKELVFKSINVARKGESQDYKIKGEIMTGKNKYPASFSISSKGLGQSQSRFSAQLESDNLRNFLGAEGSARGDFDLVFRFNPRLDKDSCLL